MNIQILHSKIVGEGSPLLILHGFLGMSDNWKTLGDKYAEKGFEVHLIDLRNHGRSFHTDEFSHALMTEDLQVYLHTYAIQKASIIGHSMGGKAAMRFAGENPEKTQALIVADIAPRYYPPDYQQLFEGLHALDFERIKSRQEAEAILGEYIEHPETIRFLLKNLYRRPDNTYDLRFNLKSLTKNTDKITEALPENTVFLGKTLFLKGENSNYISDLDLPDIKKHFPKAQTETIAKAGHWLHVDNPQSFLEKTLAFLLP